MASKPNKTSPEAVEEKKAKQEKRNLELDVTLHDIRKRFVEGTIMNLDEKKVEDVRIIPTGSITLDPGVGCGLQRVGAHGGYAAARHAHGRDG